MAERILGTTRFVRGAQGKGMPLRWTVPARCGIHLAPFLLLTEFDGRDTLWVRFAVRVLNDGGGSRREVAPGVELSQQIEMQGKVMLASEYRCPLCGEETIFRCGCGAMNCSGASRAHGDHQDRYCASCRLWKCVRGGASLETLSGFAQVEQRSQGNAIHPRTVGGVDRPQLPPGGALVRRR